MSQLKILKTGKYSLHSALGPVVDFNEGVIDVEDIEGLTDTAINDMVANGWAKTIDEVEENKQPVIEQITFDRPRRGRPKINR